MYGWQVSSTHPTGILSCFFMQKFEDFTTSCKIEFTGTAASIPPNNNGNGSFFYTYLLCGI